MKMLHNTKSGLRFFIESVAEGMTEKDVEGLDDYPYMFNWIEFGGKKYPVRSVDIGGEWGTQNVSVESLQSALRGDEDEAADPKARAIDEDIFFYVEDRLIALPAQELGKLISDSL